LTQIKIFFHKPARLICLYVSVAAVACSLSAMAGDIPGVPSELPPFIERGLEINFSNDFLGRGGAVDDFRTQQLSLSAPAGENWLVVVDHSTLTLTDAQSPGRNDQLSASLGYRLLERSSPASVDRIMVGVGLRSIGDFAGEQMQNGFHRLIDSKVESLPYTGDTGTDLTAWVDMHHYGILRGSRIGNEDWQLGYWLRGTALATTGGEWDTVAGIYGTLSRGTFDAWLGLRRDWRSGYDAAVFRETASAEDDLAVAIGIHWGPVVLETVQQLNNDASYGQLRLIAVNHGSHHLAEQPVRLGIEAGFQVPNIAYHLGLRLSSTAIAGASGRWRRSLIVVSDFGEPQYQDDSSLFLKSEQLGAGLEWERTISDNGPWTSAYASLAVGMRREQLLGDGPRMGEESGSVKRGVLLLGLGMRVHAATMSNSWRYRLQLGLNVSLPMDDAMLEIGNEGFQAQEPQVTMLLGMSFDHS
jgi:hypothetical protein